MLIDSAFAVRAALLAVCLTMAGAVSVRAPEMRAYIENNGCDAVGSTPEQFNAFTRADIAKRARELKAAGIQPQ